MPPRSGLKRKRIEAGEPLFILEGKSPEPADNSAAGSFLKWVLSVLDPLTAGAPNAPPRRACSVRESALRPIPGSMILVWRFSANEQRHRDRGGQSRDDSHTYWPGSCSRC